VDDGGVDVTLVYFDDCPNWRLAEARLREVVAEIGDPSITVTYQRIPGGEQTGGAAIGGSPTVLMDGVDPFAVTGGPVGLACRLYPGAGRTEGAPTVDQLRVALSRRREVALAKPTVPSALT
jgi:hypothetical protein